MKSKTERGGDGIQGWMWIWWSFAVVCRGGGRGGVWNPKQVSAREHGFTIVLSSTCHSQKEEIKK
jgi:hypothetical protein